MDKDIIDRKRVEFTHAGRVLILEGDELDVDESIAMQKLTGNTRTWAELCFGMDRGDAEAIKLFYWLARVRAGEKIEYHSADMRFKWRDFAYRYLPPAEPAAARDVVASDAEPQPA